MAFYLKYAILSALVWATSSAYAAPGRPKEIQVMLFGRPCLLQGPEDEETLKLIHSISPDQIYPTLNSENSKDQIKKAQEKLSKVANLPTGLDRYREELKKRLVAQQALLEGIEGAKKTHRAGNLISTTKNFVPQKKQKEFEKIARKFEAKDAKTEDVVDQLLEFYNEAIGADPQEDFHRAIQRMNIQYTCLFDDNTGEGEGEDD